MAAEGTKQVPRELPGLIRVHPDGTVDRLLGSPFVPPSPKGDPETPVLSKDIVISDSPKISARLYLPKSLSVAQPREKRPILVYFHGGGFCIESAFSLVDHRYLNNLVSEAEVVAVSVEYRLAPEHPLPIAYDDCWDALIWVASHLNMDSHGSDGHPYNKDPWLINYGDFGRLYIGGDSAGANIVHNVAMPAGAERLPHGGRILGAFLALPYFWGSELIGSEEAGEGRDKSLANTVWEFVYPGAPGGVDNPMVNPAGPGAPSLKGLGCDRVLVCVAGKDMLRYRGVWYGELVRESGWRGELKVFESEGEEHGFNVLHPETENAKAMIKTLGSFLRHEGT